MNPIFAEAPTTIFETMSSLAREHGAINLGQGFPDDAGPQDVREAAAAALIGGSNQYPSMMGTPELRQAIAAHYARWQELALDPATETLVTSGATEALAAALLAIVSPGDEVVLFEPMYDAYLPLVRQAGGVARFVTLRPPHWRFNEDDLEAAISSKTKAVVFNNPHNPCGAVYSREEIDILARVCARHDVIVISDEVWEHVVFDGRRHASILSIPAMRDRAIKIGSAGKMFSLTGWKVGLVAAAPPLLRAVSRAHQFLTYTTPPNLQAGVAYGLAKDDAYFEGMRAAFARGRDRLGSGLKARGLHVLPSEGTYFLCADIATLGFDDDAAFCRRLVETRGVAAIPVSAFYAREPVRSVVRFCFAKSDAVIYAALARLDDLARL